MTPNFENFCFFSFLQSEGIKTRNLTDSNNAMFLHLVSLLDEVIRKCYTVLWKGQIFFQRLTFFRRIRPKSFAKSWQHWKKSIGSILEVLSSLGDVAVKNFPTQQKSFTQTYPRLFPGKMVRKKKKKKVKCFGIFNIPVESKNVNINLKSILLFMTHTFYFMHGLFFYKGGPFRSGFICFDFDSIILSFVYLFHYYIQSWLSQSWSS